MLVSFYYTPLTDNEFNYFIYSLNLFGTKTVIYDFSNNPIDQLLVWFCVLVLMRAIVQIKICQKYCTGTFYINKEE